MHVYIYKDEIIVTSMTFVGNYLIMIINYKLFRLNYQYCFQFNSLEQLTYSDGEVLLLYKRFLFFLIFFFNCAN